jgi:hypothetical protein
MHWLISILVIALSSLALAQQATNDYSKLGTLIVTNFASAPFPHPARAEGHHYRGERFPSKEHYSDSTVAMFVPRDFSLWEGQVDILIHFHGWRSQWDRMASRFKLVEQFSQSGKNAILVMPQGPRNAPDSFGGKLEDDGGFRNFIEELTGVLRNSAPFKGKEFRVGRMVLSGHSGGYQVISSILDHGGLPEAVSEVWLFDALYAQSDRFLSWQQKTHGRLLNIHTPQGGTRQRTLEMMAELSKRQIRFLGGLDTGLEDDQLRTNRLVFIETDMGHNDVLEKRSTFLRFLQTSGFSALEKLRETSPGASDRGTPQGTKQSGAATSH